jgi:hypothetical protein
MPLTDLLTRDADPNYLIEHGNYLFYRYGEPRAKGYPTVAIAYSAGCPIPTTPEDIDNLVLHKHGAPELVHNWVQDTRRKLAGRGGDVGRQMASEIYMIEGRFDIDHLNAAIQGNKRGLLAIIENANTLTADGLSIELDTSANRQDTQAKPQEAITMTEPTRVTVADGKYTVINDNGQLTALRHGERWNREITGDNLIYWLTVELAQAREELQRLRASIPASPAQSSLVGDKTLTARQAGLMASIMEEAAQNLAGLMDTKKAEELSVREFLPDELDGSAIMLREAYGIPAPNAEEALAEVNHLEAVNQPEISKGTGASLVAQARSNARRNRP